VTSIARTILATRWEPVAVMVDADAVGDRSIGERRAGLGEVLGQFGAPSLFRVLLFVPEMEAAFFHDQRLVDDLTAGRALTAEDKVRAEYEPRNVLSRLLREQGREPEDWIRVAVEQVDLAAVREGQCRVPHGASRVCPQAKPVLRG
jgi:hypothetical protein